ncbi:tyrosine--tRNA ligase [Candidatus Dojkabacteria bacterium]|nr:tyrosine--tRNA ligase [Candidatus Dojkabacteria bacterium]
MKYKVTQAVFQKCPKLKVGLLTIKNLNSKPNPDHTYQFLCREIDEKREKFAQQTNPEILQNIKIWDQAFEKIGLNSGKIKPSHTALWGRAIKESTDIPNINSLVNLYNAMSIKHLVPIGGHNLKNINGDIEVGPNHRELPFTEMNSDETTATENTEFVYADTEKVMTRNWVWRQSEQTKTTESTTEIFIPIDTIGMSEDEIQEIAEDTLAAIKHFYPEAQARFAIADSTKPEVELDTMTEFTTEKKIEFEGHDISRDEKIINQILKKAVEDILPDAKSMEQVLKSGRRLNVYLGVDPTGPTLHVGHAVSMRRLELFRRLGHKVYLLIGDFTARIGDPDKLSTRKPLTADQVKQNLKRYKEQAKAFLDIDNADNPIEIVFNNDWLGEMNFSDVLNLASKFSVQQMMRKEMFQNRMKEDRPVYIHEFMYPMMQGYDNVQLKIDIQFGGNDQLFNMLAGRQLVGDLLGKTNFIIAGKLLTSPDGVKMGKTTGNMIKLSDSPEDIYGKVMSYPDSHIIPGFELLTSADLDEVADISNRLNSGENPMVLKKELAHRITAEFKSPAEADKAQEYFEKVFQTDQADEAEIQETKIDKELDSAPILDLLTDITDFAESRGAARRLIEQGAVKIDDRPVSDFQKVIDLDQDFILKAGKRITRVVR